MNKNGKNIRRITCISGTPGTGKSTLARLLQERGFYVLEIEEFARRRGIYSYIEKGETLVIDLPDIIEALERHLSGLDEAFLVGHLSHNLPNPESVVVLRTKPSVLRQRLVRKGWTQDKVSENVEAEALAVCLGEALDIHGEKVNEIDTTETAPEEALGALLDVHEGKKRYPPSTRNWLLEHILEESRR